MWRYLREGVLVLLLSFLLSFLRTAGVRHIRSRGLWIDRFAYPGVYRADCLGLAIFISDKWGRTQALLGVLMARKNSVGWR